MTVYYQRTRQRDVGNTMSFLGVPGGHTFYNMFYKQSDSFHHKMNEELEYIIDKGLTSEIQATIEKELKGEYKPEEIHNYVQSFLDGKGELPVKLKPLPIVASYDMGWNKRSTGRVYNSPSRHAFMI